MWLKYFKDILRSFIMYVLGLHDVQQEMHPLRKPSSVKIFQKYFWNEMPQLRKIYIMDAFTIIILAV